MIEDFANKQQSEARARKEQGAGGPWEDVILHLGETNSTLSSALTHPKRAWDVPPDCSHGPLFLRREMSGKWRTSFHSSPRGDSAGENREPVQNSLAQENPNVFPARTYQAFCDEERDICVNTQSGRSLYYDDNHVSDSGAELTAPIIIDAIEAAAATPAAYARRRGGLRTVTGPIRATPRTGAIPSERLFQKASTL